MRRLSPMAVAVVAGVLALLLIAYVFAGGSRENRDSLTDRQATAATAADPRQRCAAQDTYELIERELFRRAALLRVGEQGAFEQLSDYSTLRMSAPKLASFDQQIGAIACSGALTLDLPPGFETEDGRRMLAADIGYSFQPEAATAGDVLTLSNVDAIIRPLATIRRIDSEADEPSEPAEPSPDDQGAPSSPTARADTPAPRRQPPAARPREESPAVAPTRPSFNCRYARTRGEIAVCGDAALAALDRQMAAQFYRGVARGTAAQRAQLQRTRGRFLARRDACRSTSCMAEAYRDRMTEIGAIMAGAAAKRPSASPPQSASVPPPAAASGPSFNCRYASTRGEIAVCGDAGLASLDRQMAAQFSLASSRGTAAQRALLQETSARFIRYRDACRSQSCIAAAYRSRMKEISDIMAGRWKVP